MPGIAEILLGAAPIAGGALVGVAAGNLNGPDVRGRMKQNSDFLERIRRKRRSAGRSYRAASTGASTISSRPVNAAVRYASGGVLSGQLARHLPFLEHDLVHHHLVARQPRQNQLAGDIYPDDGVVGHRGRVRAASHDSGDASPPTRTPPRSVTQRASAEPKSSCIAIQCRSPRRRRAAGCPEPRNHARPDRSRSCARHRRLSGLFQHLDLFRVMAPSFSAPAT